MLNKIHLSITTITSIACVVLIILLYRSCSVADSKAKDFDTMLHIHMQDSTELMDKNNKLGQVTVTAQTYELAQKDLDKYVAENADLKNKLANSYSHVSSVSTSVTDLHIDTIKIKVPIHDTIPCGDIDLTYPVLDRYYSFDFRFKNKRGFRPDYFITNLDVSDTLTDVIGIKKSGFLNMKHELVSEQTHSNKYVKIKATETIVKSEAKPKRFGVGASAGWGLSFGRDGIVRASPCLQLSVNYNVFEF